LKKVGFEVHAGQTVQYVVTDAKSRWINERVTAAQLLKPNTRYDAKEYVKMLFSAGETLLGVFGYTASKIQAEAVCREKQIALS
jgi:DNA polymerase elongation subunit (family B)